MLCESEFVGDFFMLFTMIDINEIKNMLVRECILNFLSIIIFELCIYMQSVLHAYRSILLNCSLSI
jgi:hypothetical protein